MKKTLLSIAFLILSLIISLQSNKIIESYPLLRPVAPDVLHDFLPYLPSMGYIADFIVITSFLVLIFLIKSRPKETPFFLSLIASVYFVRAILILLNPLGDSFANFNYVGLFPGSNSSQGMFPSGHTATVFIVFLLIEKQKHKKLKYFFLILLLLEIVTLLLARGHYSMDLAGAIMLSYSLYRLFDDHKKKFLLD